MSEFKSSTDALDQLSDCASQIAFLIEIFGIGSPGDIDLEGGAAGLCCILNRMLSEMDESIQYLRKKERG